MNGECRRSLVCFTPQLAPRMLGDMGRETISGLPVSFKEKMFLKRLSFTEKKVFQSEDLAIKICRQMQRYFLWSGLATWRQGF